AQLLATPLQPLQLLRELVACAVCRLGTPRRPKSPLRLLALRLEPRELHVDAGDPLGRLRQRAPQLDLAPAEGAKARRELACAREASLRARQLWRLQPCNCAEYALQRRDQRLRGGDQPR